MWIGVKRVDLHEDVEAGCLEVTVKGNGYDLRRLIAKRRDIFAAYLQMKPEEREDKAIKQARSSTTGSKPKRRSAEPKKKRLTNADPTL